MLSYWLRVIRIRFLLSSVIAVSVGIAISFSNGISVNLLNTILTMVGVIALHASVDLLNDYSDFKRGIDTRTKRTKMSGGTGVLPEGLLKPESVRRAGIVFLVIGASIGSFFIISNGIVIAILLGFAVMSIYFYSTKIVDFGLAEIFVLIKGTCIVLGTFFIQSNFLAFDALIAGVIMGILSSLVLFVTSFPDHDADKEKGRKNIVIITGKETASKLFWIFPVFAYVLIVAGVVFFAFPVFVLFTLLAMPIAVKSGILLHRYFDDQKMIVSAMENTLLFSRITGVLLVLGFVIGFIYK